MSGWKRCCALLTLIIVLVLLLYGSVWNHGFVADDYTWLEVAVQSAKTPSDVFSLHISGFFRPMVHALFNLNYAAFGMDPRGYNVVNIAIEICCALMFVWVAARLTSSWSVAFIGVILFTTHPSHGEAVGWICARTTSLLALMSLFTLASWIRWRETNRRRWWILAFSTYCLALMTKEEAAVLLPIVLVMDVVLLGQQYDTIRRSASRLWRDRKVILLFVTALGAYLLLQLHFQSQNYLVRHGEYLWHPGAAINCLNHLAVLFIPKGVARPLWIQVVFVVEVLLAVVVLRHSLHGESRLAVFGLAFALLALLPTSFFKDHFGARYYYVPSIGSSLVWASVVLVLFRSTGVHRILRVSWGVLVVVTVLAQVHHLDHKLHDWNNKGRKNASYLRAAQRIAPLLRSIRDSHGTVCVLDSPMATPHMKSLLWLVGGPAPESVIVTPADSRHIAVRQCDLILHWDDRTQAFISERMIGVGTGQPLITS